MNIKEYFCNAPDEIICFYLDQIEDLYASMMPDEDTSTWIAEDKAKCTCLVDTYGGISEAIRKGQYDEVDMNDDFIIYCLNELRYGLLVGFYCQYEGKPWG